MTVKFKENSINVVYLKKKIHLNVFKMGQSNRFSFSSQKKKKKNGWCHAKRNCNDNLRYLSKKNK